MAKQEGEKRSHNEISADVELEIWEAKFQGPANVTKIYTNMRLTLEKSQEA